jgi:hypothetical protein
MTQMKELCRHAELAAERELFHGELRLCSKSDDDLPIV